MNLQNILTEKRNDHTFDIDQVSTLEMVKKINDEDKTVASAIESILPQVAKVIDWIVAGMKKGGRLIYIGAGTSGRLGILDASECPPTYGTSPDQVIAIIAGGDQAIQYALEGAEDDEEKGREDITAKKVGPNDVVIGIAASGRTPYTIAAMKQAKELGAKVAALVCTPQSEMEAVADEALVAEVGPEVVTGSTRMKAGTAQKLILNMLSTGTMIQMGKVYSNLMVDVMASNEKLKERAKLIVAEAAGVTLEEADAAMKEFKSAKPAILSLVTGLKGPEVAEMLQKHNGHLRAAIEDTLKLS
ncbi:N-acetylmuramic acid 6-phosphate etherase [Falsibacillus albus]|uniref:N-acetylmuramic acid 6-phosphate etherase n=1 Tax=Falsibacillus albus TaxID=2478915 RepID=A0A3L7K1U4_9BACI|nr:N-acetylmuramic acid 6-phosphate etherase [Falsibacillus albus]RLQ96585.1 N-acetylmuramic acid 6-phosphate etherase [Falsibacillus albus]